ncbi:hypothetical protein BKE38_03960 [Pseudoroseomonas deserti]|uniref:Uncharacterized protein n=1 Tax=Teichococcus deserti TaxID=1817963 RepID=A0A1V2H6J0_9PROT|nr:hypothetical protein [Pseudoroseomonas deserti]ONG57876.1 hypothetical protein BKE38_03960 [Pseudoroseomonas deserti]
MQAIAAAPLLRSALLDLEQWKTAVTQRMRDYAAAELLLRAMPGDPGAATAFAARGERLMDAINERQRRETAIRALRHLLEVAAR